MNTTYQQEAKKYEELYEFRERLLEDARLLKQEEEYHTRKHLENPDNSRSQERLAEITRNDLPKLVLRILDIELKLAGCIRNLNFFLSNQDN